MEELDDGIRGLRVRRHCEPGPRRVVEAIRHLPGVIRADALFGVPDVIALVAGDDLRSMGAVIDRIVETPGVIGTETKVVRWIDDAG